MIGAIARSTPVAISRPVRAAAVDRFEASPAAPVEMRPCFAPRPLDSVEFKLLLDPARAEDREGLYRQLERLGFDVTRPDDDDPKRRTVEYLDTPDFQLKEHGYVLRSREKDKAKPLLMLKFRDPDRIRAAGANVEAAEDGESKFEKDVTPSKTLYASSCKTKVKELPSSLREAAEVFPGLEDLGISGKLERVRDRVISEEVHPLAEFPWGTAEVAVWYEGDKPVIAELSFAVDPADEAKGAKVLQALKSEAAGWLSTGGTKTEYVYGKS